MKNNTARTARGFTLIEVLIALVVLATGLLALAKFQGTLMQDNALAKQRTEATMLAQQKIEQLRSYSLMSSSNFNIATYNSMATGSDSITGTSAIYSRSWTVTKPTKATDPQYNTVTVSMVWRDNGGTSQTYTLSTNIAANDPINTGQLIATTTLPTTTTSTTSTSTSSTTSSTSTSTTATSTSTTSTTSTTTTTTTVKPPPPATCTITITGSTKGSDDTVSFTDASGNSKSCTVSYANNGNNTTGTFTCSNVVATAGVSISLVDTSATKIQGTTTSTVYKGTATTDCKTTTATAGAWQ